MSFSEKLSEILAVKNMTQQQLCDKTGISKSLMSQYLSKRTNPSYVNARLIADLWGSSVDWLLSENWLSLEDDLREQSLLKAYRKLNEEGKLKVDDNINDLLEIPKYTQSNFILKSSSKFNQS